MTSKELETKLKSEVSEDVVIREHPSIMGLSQVYWRGEFVTTCPTYDVRDEFEKGYGIEFPNGSFQSHRSSDQVTEITKAHIAFMTSDDGAQLLADEARIREEEANEKAMPIVPLD